MKNISCKFNIRWMIFKPKVVHKSIILLFLSLMGGIVMVLAIIITKSYENWGIWKIFIKKTSYSSMSILKFLITYWIILTYILSNTMPDHISSKKNSIYFFISFLLLKKFEHILYESFWCVTS